MPATQQVLNRFGRAVSVPDATADTAAEAAQGALITALQAIPVVDHTATYNVVLGDQGKLHTMTVAGANSFVLPQDSDAAIPVGSRIRVMQTGAGLTTITAGTGATLRATPGAKLAAQYGVAEIIKIAANTWAATGALQA